MPYASPVNTAAHAAPRLSVLIESIRAFESEDNLKKHGVFDNFHAGPIWGPRHLFSRIHIRLLLSSGRTT